MTGIFPQCFACYWCRDSDDNNPSPKKTYALDKGELTCKCSGWIDPMPIRYMDYLFMKSVGCHTFALRTDGIDLKAV